MTNSEFLEEVSYQQLLDRCEELLKGVKKGNVVEMDNRDQELIDLTVYPIEHKGEKIYYDCLVDWIKDRGDDADNRKALGIIAGKLEQGDVIGFDYDW